MDKNEPKKPPAGEAYSAASLATRENFKGPCSFEIVSRRLTGVKFPVRVTRCACPLEIFKGRMDKTGKVYLSARKSDLSEIDISK